MKTVMDKKSVQEDVIMKYPYSMEDQETITFSIQGQTIDRSYEDRSVFFQIKTSDTKPIHKQINAAMWLDGEDAIELGLKLINHGKYALEANMINHQLIHQKQKLSKFINDGIVENIIFKLIEKSPNNYGYGFHKFLITPIFSNPPKYEEDFCFEQVIYFSMIKKDFKNQIKYMIGKTSYSFENYDYKKEVEAFNKKCK